MKSTMRSVFSAPGDFIYFKSQVPLHKIPIGTKQWRYYDFGPKVVPPLICLPSIAGTAEVYYKQVMSLSMKGYRIISVDIPRVWDHHEWVQAFEKFLDAIDVHYVHLYGTSLGGFLAQLFAQHRPRRVRSLILSNSFLETQSFSAAIPWAPIVGWSPSFLLKRYVLTGIRDGPHEPFIADSVDFVVAQVETLSKDDLAARLTLTTSSASVGSLLLTESFITIIDTNDYCAISQNLKDEVIERYPGAKRAGLKSGGDFPFLSRPDEVNLHLQLHLRRVGVEARPDLIHNLSKSKDDRDGSSSKQQDESSSSSPSSSKENNAGSSGGGGGVPPPSSSSSAPALPPDDGGVGASENRDDQLMNNSNASSPKLQLVNTLPQVCIGVVMYYYYYLSIFILHRSLLDYQFLLDL